MRRILSWGVIWAAVLLLFLLNMRRSGQQPAQAQATNLLPPADVRLEIVCRYIVGAHDLVLSINPNKTDDNATLYVKQLHQYAKSDADRLRVVPVVARLLGSDAALHELQGLTPTLAKSPLAVDASELEGLYSGAQPLDGTERQGLITRHGWFGRLAASYDRPDSIDAAIVHRQVTRTVIAMVLVASFAGGGVLLGGVLLIIGVVRFADGKLRLQYRPARADAVTPTPLPPIDMETMRPLANVAAELPALATPTPMTGPFLEAFAIYVGGTVAISLGLGLLLPAILLRPLWVRLGFSLLPVVIAICWPLWRGVGLSAWLQGLGWHTGRRGVVLEALLGLVGYIAGLPILAAGAAISMILVSISHADPTHPIINEARGGPAAVLGLYLLASVYAPIIEETLFRGALFHDLRARHGWFFSAMTVSLIFAAMHPQGWAAIPVLGAIAIVLAGIREWRGTIISSAAAHALNNGVVMTLLVVTLS